jgi:hypothetical protein
MTTKHEEWPLLEANVQIYPRIGLFMRTSFHTIGRSVSLLALTALGAGFLQVARADTIFNNSTNDLSTRFNPGTLEVGDEILLAGSARYLTNFSFEYWGTTYGTNGASFAGPVEARVRFYVNDGSLFHGYATPSTMFYDSGWFDGFGPTPRFTLDFLAGSDFSGSGLFIPSSDITWSVQFQGMGAGDAVGVDIYSPPVVGADYPDYWENNGGWTLETNDVPMDFATVWEASVSAVPEPSAVALLFLGGAALTGLPGFWRRKN